MKNFVYIVKVELGDVDMEKEQAQVMIDYMKEKLQEYWVNEFCLPISVQVKSMAIMDLFIEDYFKEE